MVNHRQIEDRAAAWLAERDGGDWSGEDESTLTGWLEESIAHRVAFLRLEAVWEETRRVRALAAGRVPGTVPDVGEWRNTPFFDLRRQPHDAAEGDGATPAAAAPQEIGEPGDDVVAIDTTVSISNGDDRPDHPSDTLRPVRTRGGRGFQLAACLLLAIGIGSYFVLSPADRYSTPIGGTRSVPLRDGSNMTLNTASSVRVTLTPHERRIDLQKGEAFFEVAKDPTRPFVVRVGDKRVIAVGTKFSVRRDENDVRVVVTEGTVRLESDKSVLSPNKSVPALAAMSPAGSGEGRGAGLPKSSNPAAVESTSLAAGTVARTTDDDVLVEKESVPQAEEILSWRQGFLRFHDTALTDAVAEFNRYSSHTIVIGDPRVAAIHISGTFHPTNYEAFVRLLSDGFSIHAAEDGDRIILMQD